MQRNKIQPSLYTLYTVWVGMAIYMLQIKKINCKLLTFIPCSLPISESSDSLSPEVVIPTAPATELEAEEIK